MKKDILNWNDVKEKYLEFHKMDSFTENMAIDIDFGYWLVNNCIMPDVSTRFYYFDCWDKTGKLQCKTIKATCEEHAILLFEKEFGETHRYEPPYN